VVLDSRVVFYKPGSLPDPSDHFLWVSCTEASVRQKTTTPQVTWKTVGTQHYSGGPGPTRSPSPNSAIFIDRRHITELLALSETLPGALSGPATPTISGWLFCRVSYLGEWFR